MTKHKPDCQRVFKRYDKTCPRCVELINGAAPRKGWQADYFKREREEQFNRRLKEHDCKKANCGPVCTFGDW